MTYSQGSTIQASDYNTFVSGTGNNLSNVWGVGSGSFGWGQNTTNIANVAISSTVSSVSWATLVANLTSAVAQTGSGVTLPAQPVPGNTITALANIATAINAITANRGNAVASGTTYGTFSGTVSKATGTGSGQSAWTITFTNTVQFANATAARYFFNAGGLIKLMYGKSSTGTSNDPTWNTLAGQCGNIFFAGNVNGSANIAGTVYNAGATRIGGSGGTQSTLATVNGFYNLTPGGAAVTLFKLTDATSPYTNDYIQSNVSLDSNSQNLIFTTTWVDGGTSTAGATRNISGGTQVASPATAIGSATGPTTLLNYIPPSINNLTNSWGTPNITCTVA